MKTYVYIRDNGKKWVIAESGSCPDNCDCVTAIGRPPHEEKVGCGSNRREAFEDALSQSD